MKILGVASKLHGKEYLEGLITKLSDSLKELGFNFENVLTNINEIDKIEINEIPVVFILTGGTSKIIRKISEKAKAFPLVLVSHPYHNSLPSALSAKSRLRAKGTNLMLHFHVPSFDKEYIERVVKVANLYEYIKSLKVVVVGDLEKEEIESFERISGKVQIIGIDTIGEKLRNIKIGDNDLKRIIKKIDITGSNPSLIKGPLSLYKVSKGLLEENKANAFTIDCFPFIVRYKFTPCLALSLLLSEGIPAACEADLRSLLLLAIAQNLTKTPGWIFNPSDYHGGILTGAHCTIALSLTNYATLIPHFESGNPYAISGTLREGTYTIAAISPDYKVLAATRATLIASGTLTGGRCRTQVVMKLEEKDPRPFTEKAISNHHVLIKGDILDYLEKIAKILGMKFLRY